MNLPSVAFIGAGPTTIYTLQALLKKARCPFAFTVFEAQPVAGRGTPYRPGWNDPALLSNISSLEIPPVAETLIDWMKRQAEGHLAGLGVDPNKIDERQFYPRLALGEYFSDQLQALVDLSAAKGVVAEVRTRCRVVDALSEPKGVVVVVKPDRGDITQACFDHLVLATGHQWPENPEVRPGYFVSPWPASALAKVSPCRVGIRGSSLTAIDAAVTLAVSHGDFTEDGPGLAYAPKPNTEGFHLTMASRKGLLPEADFFHPVPYEPLTILTPQAIQDLIALPAAALLDEVFALFKQELSAVDPEYAERTNLSEITLETFGYLYFADRIAADPFVWAQENLNQATENYANQITSPWRYAILRMHEVISAIVPQLDDDDFDRFMKHLKPVFVDDYATVPHESIKRMLALHRAGKLQVRALGDDYRLDTGSPEGGAVLHVGPHRTVFPVFVDATGQPPLGAKEFPFPSLRRQGIVREASAGAVGAVRGVVVDDQFHLLSKDAPPDQLFCLSLPFILGRHPFIQGITSSHEMGELVGSELADALSRTAMGLGDEPPA